MASAFKCDRCGMYYDDSTSLIGPTLYKSKNTRMLDLCEECKASLTEWLTSATDKREDEKHIESFIKLRSVAPMATSGKPYMLVPDFLDALSTFFDYKGNREVDDFITNSTVICSPFSNMIEVQEIKVCLKKYFKHEWEDEFYE